MISNNSIRSKYAPFSDAPSCLREFLNYMLTILGRSPRTVDGYYIECRTFLRFIKLKNNGKNVYKLSEEEFKNTTIFDIPQNDIINVKLYDVYDFLNFVREQFGDDSCSRARKTTALRSFYKYLSVKANLIKENPLKSLESPSIKKSLPKLEEKLIAIQQADEQNRIPIKKAELNKENLPQENLKDNNSPKEEEIKKITIPKEEKSSKKSRDIILNMNKEHQEDHDNAFRKVIAPVDDYNEDFAEDSLNPINGIYLIGLGDKSEEYLANSGNYIAFCAHEDCSYLPGLKPEIIFQYSLDKPLGEDLPKLSNLTSDL